MDFLRSRSEQPDLLNVFCETEEVSRQYSGLLELPIKAMACLNGLDIATSVAGLSNNLSKSLHFLLTGHAGVNKGYDRLGDAIRQNFDVRSDIRFTVHGVRK